MPSSRGRNHDVHRYRVLSLPAAPIIVLVAPQDIVNIAAAGQKMWERVCETLGIPRSEIEATKFYDAALAAGADRAGTDAALVRAASGKSASVLARANSKSNG